MKAKKKFKGKNLSVFLLLLALVVGLFADLPMVASAAGENLAYMKTATASSTESGSYPASSAVDANGNTRWSSSYADNQNLIIDLGAAQNVSSVKIAWEAAYASQYQVQVSNNYSTWTTVYENYNGKGGTETINFSPVNARYVKLYCIKRATQYGFSVYEFEIYGNDTTNSGNSGNNGNTGNSGNTQDGGAATSNDFKVVGYAPNWYGTGYLNQIDYSQLTHLIYAFAIPTTDGKILALNDNGFMTALVNKAHANGVKVSIAIGGWSYNGATLESTFAQATNTDAKCKTLANAMLAVVDQYNLDGIDVDWEYPRSNTSWQFETLLKYLREGLNARGSDKVLTAAVAGTTTTGYSQTALSYLNWVNVMAYDGDGGAGHSPYSYAVNSTNTWKNVGLSKDKVVLGVPFYERPNWATYASIVQKDRNNAYKDSTVINGTTVYYNGLNTIAQKTEFACDNAGGIMIWEMSQDYTADKSLSLLNKIHETIQAKLGSTGSSNSGSSNGGSSNSGSSNSGSSSNTGNTGNNTASNVNLAYGKNVTVSSTESSDYAGAKAVDANGTTRWSSAYADNQNFVVDLGSAQTVSSFKIAWEAAYASQFQIQTSIDRNTWTTVYENYNATGGTQTINISAVDARYVKVYGIKRATAYGFSIYEFEVYGAGSTTNNGSTGGSSGNSGSSSNSGSTSNSGNQNNQTNTTGDIRSGNLRKIAYALVSSAENSSLDYTQQYAYIQDIGDGRGYTGGIIGFTSGTGDMLEVVQRYVQNKPNNNVLSKYVSALRSVNGTSSHNGLGTAFENDWKTAARDAEMIEAQNSLVNEWYLEPAVQAAKEDGLSVLGQFVYYDAIVMHGPGESSDSFGGIRNATKRAAQTPKNGGNEATFLEAFLSARTTIMLQEEAHSDLSRINAQRAFLQAGNYNLNLPLSWTMYGEAFTLTDAKLAQLGSAGSSSSSTTNQNTSNSGSANNSSNTSNQNTSNKTDYSHTERK